MSAVAWIAVGSLTVWVWLLLGQGFFWRTDQRLPARKDPARWPSVAVVVPARDEAEVLPVSLTSLLAQDYPGDAEIILVDDCSEDGTGELARALSARCGGLPLTVVTPGEPEQGWTGKLWALRHGMALARQRKPEFLLLTDADIAHEPDSLRELVAAAGTEDADGFDLVSQMARLRVTSVWERLVVPAFVYFFAQLYPFRRVNRKGARTAAAAGGCVLLRAGCRGAGRCPGLHPPGGDRRRVTGARGAQDRRQDLAGARRAGGQCAAVSAPDGPVADGLAQRVRATASQPGPADGHRTRTGPGLRRAAGHAVRGPGDARRRDGGGGRSGLGGDGRDVSADARVLPAVLLAGSSAPLHRSPLSADDGRFRGAALPGAGAAWKGRTYARPEAAPEP